MNTESKNISKTKTTDSEVEAFLTKVAEVSRNSETGNGGRLLFAIDATLSREPTWDMACNIQSEMFVATQKLGGLEVQLAFYRGFGEMKVTKWLSGSKELVSRMNKVRCVAGRTQIRKVLRHAIKESKIKVRAKINGEEIRIEGKKRDDLQNMIDIIKKLNIDLPLQFINFRE